MLAHLVLELITSAVELLDGGLVPGCACARIQKLDLTWSITLQIVPWARVHHTSRTRVVRDSISVYVLDLIQ